MYPLVKIPHGINFYVILLLFEYSAYKKKNTLNVGGWNITYEKVLRRFNDPPHFAIVKVPISCFKLAPFSFQVWMANTYFLSQKKRKKTVSQACVRQTIVTSEVNPPLC